MHNRCTKPPKKCTIASQQCTLKKSAYICIVRLENKKIEHVIAEEYNIISTDQLLAFLRIDSEAELKALVSDEEFSKIPKWLNDNRTNLFTNEIQPALIDAVRKGNAKAIEIAINLFSPADIKAILNEKETTNSNEQNESIMRLYELSLDVEDENENDSKNEIQ